MSLFLSQPLCIVTILSNELDYEALDNNPVDIIVFLILPEISKSENLQTLAQVARLLRNTDIIQSFANALRSNVLIFNKMNNNNLYHIDYKNVML